MMTWYFKVPTTDGDVIAVTPRVASTSQRKLYQKLGYAAIDESHARELYEAGISVLATVREPLQRTISAYRRHAPGFINDSFEDYVIARYSWDSHVMPQHMVHLRNGIEPTHWQLFEDLIAEIGEHENATPQSHKDQIKVEISDEFMQWFREVFAEDYELYESVKEATNDAGELAGPDDS